MLTKNDAVTAAMSMGHSNATIPIQYRVHDMALRVLHTIQGWVIEHEIDELQVNIETPVLNRRLLSKGAMVRMCPVCAQPRNGQMPGVDTLMKQMRMLAAYEEILFQIEGCAVKLGEVNNQTAKAIFTGDGHARKSKMIDRSVWAYRPDVKDREHLADAQAIAKVSPVTTVRMYGEDRVMTNARYQDGKVGKGPAWKGPVKTKRQIGYERRLNGAPRGGANQHTNPATKEEVARNLAALAKRKLKEK